MNEFVSDEEPEPLSGGLKEFINISIVKAGRMKNHRLTAHYRELEQEYEEEERGKQEAREVGALSVHADAFFSLHKPSGDKFDQTITHGDATLRRCRRKWTTDDREHWIVLYFFNDAHGDEQHSHVWTSASPQIHWSDIEQRNVSAAEVRAHLDEAFPYEDMRMHVEPRRFGKVALPRALSQKA